jgi:hypothetical protein
VISAAIALCVASQRLFIVVVYFVINSVRKLLDTPLYSAKYTTMVNAVEEMCKDSVVTYL